MRRAAKVDENQPEIVQALREIGATVEPLHFVGRGFPDIAVGYRGNNWLFEIKTKAGKLTEDEHDWHGDWRGQVHVIRTADQAIAMVSGYASTADAPPF